jgi:hypothetical protein
MFSDVFLEVEIIRESESVWLVRIYSVNGVTSDAEARASSQGEAFTQALALAKPK